MKYDTDFYRMLNNAQNDNYTLVRIIKIIKPLINKYSLVEDIFTGKFFYDEDLESTLIEYVIKLIKKYQLSKKLSNNKNVMEDEIKKFLKS